LQEDTTRDYQGNPDITFTDTGKKLGEMWRALTDDEKKKYAK